MLHCKKCRIDVEGEHTNCPLCQNLLSGEPTEQVFPQIPENKSVSNLVIKIISFVSIAAIAICFGVNYMFPSETKWSLFSAAGIICAWITTYVGITYRKRILKNLTLQLFVVTGLALLWDRFTGQHGWSIDFVIPCGCVATMLSVFVISRILKLSSRQYVMYMIMGGLYGIIPFVCLVFHIVEIIYPSVICSVISFITIAAFIIFRGRTTMEEMERRFHL